MVDFTKNKSWSATQVIEDNADASNVGKGTLLSIDPDTQQNVTGFFWDGSAFFTGIQINNTPTFGAQLEISQTTAPTSMVMRFRGLASGSYGVFADVVHSENVGTTDFDGANASGGNDRVAISPSGDSRIDLAKPGTSSAALLNFLNDNGIVGSVSTSANTTSYNVSSDPRLKDFKGQPSDETINDEFNKLFSCFDTFNWKNDPVGDLVWGFNAHLCIDANLDMGTEGQGSRDLALGEIYNTIPAVIEPQEVPVLYKTGDKKGEPRLNADSSPMMETVDVVVKKEIQERVSPAGVDQAKAVPVLLAKIEQLERRLMAIEGGS